MDLLGLGITGTALLICFAGAAYANFLGRFTSNGKTTNWKEVGKTFAIALVAGVPLTAAQLTGLGTVDEAAQLAILFGLINQVAGLDFGVKRLAKIVSGKPK